MATIFDIDLVALIGADVPLVQTARTKGGELHGPCPFCGGRDRFYVQRAAGHGERPLWRCRQCELGGDAVDYVQRRDGLTKGEALRELGIGRMSSLSYGRAAAPLETEPQAPVEPPSAAWQATALALVEDAEAKLWEPEGQRALGWLRRRGFTDATIRAARFGYQGYDERFDLDGQRAWAPRGIVIPWFAEGQLWRVNIRRPVEPGAWRLKPKAELPEGLSPAAGLVLNAIRELRDATPAQVRARTAQRPDVVADAVASLAADGLIVPSTRYLPLPGSPNCVYGIDDVRPGRPLVLVEGEFNAWAIRQAAGELAGAVALGAATHGRRARWLAKIGLGRPVLVALDGDAAGDLAAGYWLDTLGATALRWRPEAKDPNAMLMGGLDLWGWVGAGITAWNDRQRTWDANDATLARVEEALIDEPAPAPPADVPEPDPEGAPIIPFPVSTLGRCAQCGLVKGGIRDGETCAACQAAAATPAPVDPDLGGAVEELDFTLPTPVRLAPGVPGEVDPATLAVRHGIAVAKLASAPAGYVYVGRRMSDALPGSPLGNPFTAGAVADPIGRFRELLNGAIRDVRAGQGSYHQQQMVDELRRLLAIYRDTGRLVLACWCAPEPCHADVIAAAVVWLAQEEPVKVREGWAIWDRETAAEGLPWVTVCEHTGRTIRASRTIPQARAPFHNECFEAAIQDHLV